MDALFTLMGLTWMVVMAFTSGVALGLITPYYVRRVAKEALRITEDEWPM